MSRNMIVFVLSIVILTSTHLANAQQAKKVHRIGFLSAGSGSSMSAGTQAFLLGLQTLGYVEGKDSSSSTDMRRGRRSD
jgi:hypothetical protein